MADDSIEATLAHLQTLNSRRELLTERQAATEEQFCHRVGVLYRTGVLTERQVYELYQTFRATAMSGFGKRWDASVGARLRSRYWHGLSDPAVTEWEGLRVAPLPFPVGYYPPKGTAVVYVLYDERCEPIYLGSTGDLPQRLRAHRSDKAFAYWKAWRCESREHAYQREEQMLRQVLPRLNRKAAR